MSEVLRSPDILKSFLIKPLYLGRQEVVGLCYRENIENLLAELHPGSRIRFLREPENLFDAKAILATDEKGRKLGYIPMEENRVMSALMDGGKCFYGVIPEIPREKYILRLRYKFQESNDEKVPFSLTVDLYMRDYAASGDVPKAVNTAEATGDGSDGPQSMSTQKAVRSAPDMI